MSNSADHTQANTPANVRTVLQQAYVTITMLLGHHHGQDTPSIAQSTFSRASRCDVQSCAVPPQGTTIQQVQTHTYKHPACHGEGSGQQQHPPCQSDHVQSTGWCPQHTQSTYTQTRQSHAKLPLLNIQQAPRRWEGSHALDKQAGCLHGCCQAAGQQSSGLRAG